MTEPPEVLPAEPASLLYGEEGVDILLVGVGPELPAIPDGVEMG